MSGRAVAIRKLLPSIPRIVPCLLFSVLVAATAKAGAQGSHGGGFSAVVLHVSDGDTALVRGDRSKRVKVRLYGIDAPEISRKGSSGQPHGNAAARALRAKIRGRKVQVEIFDSDRYGRLVGLVRLDERDINREMVAEGHAWAYRSFLDGAYASEYIQAEERARRRRLGLWAESNPEPPWEFRRREPHRP